MKRPNVTSVIAHWIAAWAMILALYFGLGAVYGNGPRQEAFAAHAYAGLTVLGLVVVRLFLRTLLPWPKEKSGGSRIPYLVAEAMHWTLYALMLLTPLTGWIVASSMGCCMTVPGLPNIDRLGSGLSVGRPISAMTAYHVHVFFVWTLLALILLHVMAALFHHFVLRDPILVRMVPVLGRRAGSVSDSYGTANSQPDRPNEAGADVVEMEER
ncbi:cytochrome b [Bradyrhizobium sp. LA6.12]|uniref:cytochrome b n=1 Tax=unclassified Bradyrhizobium TaxID=2631580 RepID=UPI00339B7B6E